MDLAPGLVVADRFRLVRLLGQGGMGSIWVAQHTRLDVPCAVKFIRADAGRSPEVRSRFEREAKAAAQLRSPHVVHILDHGEWEYGPYIAMEYLEGEDLAARLKKRRVLTPREVASIAGQVGRALTKAHAARLVHRDLKPGNIFLARDDDRELVKVLDFGVAKASETEPLGSTKTGTLLGTPYYMSPEQARGTRDIDHRSDLWALAVVVYQCLTGRLPFHSTGLGELFMKIMNDPLPVPSQVASVPEGFDAWWVRAAERDPARRFQTARELADALQVALGLTVEESPLSISGAEHSRAPMASLPISPVSTPQPVVPTPLPTPPDEADNAVTVLRAPTPVQQSISVMQPRTEPSESARRSGIVIVAGAGALLLTCAVVLFLLLGHSSSAPAPSAASTTSADSASLPPPPPPSPPSPPPAALPTATAAASDEPTTPSPTASASAAPAATAAPVTTSAPRGPQPPPPPPTKRPPTKHKTDFGI